MSDSQKSFSQSSIYKLVNKRLGLVLLLILLIVGLSSYFLEQYRLLTNVQEIAIQRANQFTKQFGGLLTNQKAVDNGNLQNYIDEAPQSNIVYSEGIIVKAIVLDNRGVIAARFSRDDFPVSSAANKILEKTSHVKISNSIPMETQKIEIDNQLYILLHFPVKNATGQTLGKAVLLFLPSAERLEYIHNSVLQTALAAMFIALLTVSFIYPVIIQLTRQLSSLSRDLLKANLQTAKALGSAIAKRDSDTDAHNYRVTIYSVRLAEAIKLDTKNMQGLIKGAFLHDVGKIGTPDHILLKPGPLNDAEFSEMKKHVSYGVDIISSSSWLMDAEDVVMHHHEKYNGTGYAATDDEVVAGKDIPLVARIFAIADVFDALTSRRPYKEPMDFDTTLAEMEKNVGTHFDPELFSTFKSIARPLYDVLANRDDELPRNTLTEIVQKYFLDDLEHILNHA